MSRSYISSDLRQQVYKRAKGVCEYCQLPEMVALSVHQIDHIIAEKHGGATKLENLALSCVICNRNKGSDIASVDPSTGSIVPLYHPRKDRWPEHFRYQDAQLLGKTPEGIATVRLLKMNQSERIEERRILINADLIKIPE
ncbi:HNH endonuclease [Leptolyngbya cf. ectocarpi LEGE 11479]|uniref:HNH endonuclease n=1 Tax=Leptolyngbya cf. ectocarpi LEGE 11479 TaxID=1828722 RepID=A0A929FBR6_LEPEC|nr:HNH endonuclease signature motif containing protein [Leptolyngbya ectocarpi]MBE9069264.1 HNH endonuclease [Leptolyngbya cf. ectocarpi LEGE 11479]